MEKKKIRKIVEHVYIYTMHNPFPTKLTVTSPLHVSMVTITGKPWGAKSHDVVIMCELPPNV